jgi:hypothetical protein
LDGSHLLELLPKCDCQGCCLDIPPTMLALADEGARPRSATSRPTRAADIQPLGHALATSQPCQRVLIPPSMTSSLPTVWAPSSEVNVGRTRCPGRRRLGARPRQRPSEQRSRRRPLGSLTARCRARPEPSRWSRDGVIATQAPRLETDAAGAAHDEGALIFQSVHE